MPRLARIASLLIFTTLLGLFALPNGLSDFLQPSARAATTFTVNSTGDSPDGNTADGVCDDGSGNCTLRAAIQQANALAGDDVININATGTITLTSALPDITTNITIVGPDARRTNVSGAGAFRVFTVNGNVFVTISGLTISGGRAGSGAGVNNTGATLNLNNCSITNNTATGFGGGVNNNGGGRLSVVGTTIAYNSADSAGGLYNSGLATLADTTVSSNVAANNGGGLENVGNDFTLLSVTVYGNRAQVFGGGIHNPGIGEMTFNNTVVAGNYAGNSGPDINGARVVSRDYNLVESTSGVDISGTTTHNLTGVAPALGPLQDNGGQTPTHAPLPGSFLIDQGNASLISPLATDQRGLARVSDSPSIANAAGGDGSDIGAVEVAASEFLVVNSLADTSDGNCDAQNCTLREAINAANSAADHNTIRFNVSGTINLTGALPEIATDLAIEGPGAKSLTVKRDTGGGYRIFKIASGVNARISGLTATGGNPDEADSLGGGAVYNAGTLTLSEVALTDNHAIGGGGIINNNDGTLYLVGSTLSGNSTGFGGGGGIFNNGTLYIRNSTISGNSGGNSNGGGIFNFGGVANATITNSTIANNINTGIATISSTGSPVTLAGTIVANNQGSNNQQVDLEAAGGGIIISNGYNLIRTPASAVITQGQNPGTDIFNQNPLLGPLQDNGGPTQTQALLANSPAIDKGRDFSAGSFVNPAPRDQRGAVRPFDFTSIAPAAGGDNSDIGAFELRPVAESIASKWVNEDSTLTFGFFVGDQTITSISATSSDQALVPDSNINITGSGPERTIQITPAANRFGSATITVSLDGSNEGVLTRTFRLTVNPVNDAPTFTNAGDQTVLEDAGPQTVSNWATGISPGPFESSQTVNFVVTGNTNPSLFSAAPSISPDGTLTYTPAPDANGSATITVVLKDDGGTLNGGQDTSVPQTFVINVTAVNDAPVASDQTVSTDEDTPKAITLVANDVDGDTLTYQVVSPPAHGTLTGTGASLTYTPAADFNGADSFTFKASDPSGAQSNTATVNINVAAVNDAPVNSVPGAQQTVRNTPLVFAADNSNAISVSDVDAGGGDVRVTLTATNGTLTLRNKSGITFVTGDGTDDASMTFTGTIANVNAALAMLAFNPSAGFDGAASLQITTDDQGNTGSGGAKSDTDTVAINVALSSIEFTRATYTVAEMGGSLAVTVRREGDTSQAASVDYATDDGSTPGVVVTCAAVTGLALDRCDYTKALGTLHFAAGETEKTIVILISDDAYTEGTETAHIRLSNVGGAAILGALTSATFEITDDSPESPANPIDDASFFVRQHYHDFLNREPDAAGLAFWIGQMTNCGNPDLQVCRINVSAAFFKSIEFQETGYLVERTYKVAFGDTTSPGVAGTVPVIRLEEFLADTQRIGQNLIVGQGDWQAKLEANKVAYFLDFVGRTRFTNALPTSMTAAQFVDALFANAGVTPTAAERQAAIDEFGGAPTTSDTAARARAVRRIAENPTLNQLEKNRAFVLMEYFGYLRRNPDDAPQPGLNYSGWRFWLSKLEEFNGDFVRAEMVKAFLSSDEYRHRFGQ